jgi:uncharacterized membrane protein SpoIIM required for sporulation
MINILNLLISPKKAERHPIEVMILSAIYASLSLIFSLWIFPEHSSIIMIFLSVISCIFLVQGSLIFEEKEENKSKSEEWILKEHSKLILLLLSIFIGFMFAFIIWSIVLPSNVSETVFKSQISVINEIRSVNNIITGNAVNNTDFIIILSNNLKVLLFSFILALFYGAGSLFVLAWNASILGFVIGNLAKTQLGLLSLPLLFTKYLTHGIPEMISYFIASLAGGIIFIKIVRDDFKKSTNKKTFIDIMILIGISLLVLIIAALIETYITPFI